MFIAFLLRIARMTQDTRLQVLTPLSLLVNITALMVCAFVMDPNLGMSQFTRILTHNVEAQYRDHR